MVNELTVEQAEQMLAAEMQMTINERALCVLVQQLRRDLDAQAEVMIAEVVEIQTRLDRLDNRTDNCAAQQSSQPGSCHALRCWRG